MILRAAIFDLDGTIVETAYDWPKIKAELGTGEVPILAYLSGLKGRERSRKWKILQSHEDQATRAAVLKEGIREFLAFLSAKGIQKALVTNNSAKNVRAILKRFDLRFDIVLSRESGLWKPSGAPFTRVLEKLGLEPGECFVVGDSLYDVRAAHDAGIQLVFILRGDPERSSSFPAEVLETVADLQSRIKELLEA